MPLTRVGPKYQVTIPKVAREAIGLEVGDFVDVTPTKGGVLLRLKTVVDKHTTVHSRLRQAEEDVKAGRTHGPFRSPRGLLRSLRRAQGGSRKSKKRLG